MLFHHFLLLALTLNAVNKSIGLICFTTPTVLCPSH
jgi:hypothetical protein